MSVDTIQSVDDVLSVYDAQSAKGFEFQVLQTARKVLYSFPEKPFPDTHFRS